ncbi:MAG: hypothetical protein ACM3ZE_13375, partial [Myxococcales bacterium]
VSASSVKSAVKPGRAYVPPPPRPALKTQPKASIKPIAPHEAPTPSQEKATARPLGARAARVPEARIPEARIPEARIPEARASEPEVNDEVASAVKSANPPTEKTQIFRPNLNDPTLRRSIVPVEPAVSSPAEVAFPKEPRLPMDVLASAKAHEPHYSLDSSGSNLAPSNDAEGDTVTLSSDTIDKMLEGEKDATYPASSPADEATRVGQIPAETLAALQRGAHKEAVGHEDVTRVYDSPLREKTDSTSPGQRQSRQIDNSHQLLTQPRVIIRQDPPKSHVGRWVALGLCVAVVTAGWIYRAPVGRQVLALQATIIRGIAPAPAQMRAQAVDPLVAVSISVTPADAKLTLDGAPITNPFTVQRRSDRQPHLLVAEAPGHVSLERSVQFERDLTVMLALAPKPQVAAPPVAEAPTPEAPKAEADRPAPVAHAVRRARPVSQAPVAAPAANCEPPYTVDETGIKSYKPECM